MPIRSHKSRMDVLQFLNMVKDRPILYDGCHLSFRDNNTRGKVWSELAIELNATSHQLKAKWKNLRDNYLRHLKCIQNGSKRYKSWAWARHMEFLKPHLKFVRTSISDSSAELFNATLLVDKQPFTEKSSIQEEEFIEYYEVVSHVEPMLHDDEHEADADGGGGGGGGSGGGDDVETAYRAEFVECQDERSNLNPKNLVEFKQHVDDVKEKQQLLQVAQVPSKTMDYSSALVNHVNGNNVQCLDATDHILLGYAKIIKTFSPARQVDIKMKIYSIMMRAELEHVREKDQQKTSHRSDRHNGVPASLARRARPYDAKTGRMITRTMKLENKNSSSKPSIGEIVCSDYIKDYFM